VGAYWLDSGTVPCAFRATVFLSVNAEGGVAQSI
jgi:hypothetical protein